MGKMNYIGMLRNLYSTNLFLRVKMGMKNIRAMDAALGRPARTFGVVHVAGTNGKGSVCWKVAEALQAHGLRVGLFTSPHLSSFRERLRVDGQLISEDEALRVHRDVAAAVAAADVPATFFELVTAMGLHHFHRQEVDVAVVEAGLGGRLDATSVVEHPLASTITSIGLDHTRILGNTIESIAWEKAGIIKAGTPTVIGPQCPQAYIAALARLRGSEPVLVAAPPAAAGGDASEDFDAANVAVAACTVERALEGLARRGTGHSASASALAAATAALEHAAPPCRFERVPMPAGRLALLDVAHNEHGIRAMLRKLRRQFPDQLRDPSRLLRVVVGFSRDKELDGCVSALLEVIPSECVVAAQADSARAASTATIAETFQRCGAQEPLAGLHDCPWGVHEEVPEAELAAEAGSSSVRTAAGRGANDAPEVSSHKRHLLAADGKVGLRYTTGRSSDETRERMLGGGVAGAVAAALEQLPGGDEKEKPLLLVCGSVYMMSEARVALGMNEPVDPIVK